MCLVLLLLLLAVVLLLLLCMGELLLCWCCWMIRPATCGGAVAVHVGNREGGREMFLYKSTSYSKLDRPHGL